MNLVQIDHSKRSAELAFELIAARLAPIFELFDLEGVTEVNFNRADNVWVTRGGTRQRVEIAPISEMVAAAAVRELASTMGQESVASTASAIVDAKMPGYRFSAVLSPIAANGTILSIRKHSPRILSLSNYIDQGVLTQDVADTLAKAVKEGLNIVIGGGTDSGKTTFLNALCREIPITERVGTIEDTRELNLTVENWFPLETNAQKKADATLMIKSCMRHSPDRIICGELRDEAASDFIASTNTGHHGCMATVHCSSAAFALDRLEELCLKADSNWPLMAIQRNIGRSIHMVAHLKKLNGKRILKEIISVNGFDPETHQYRTKTIFQHQE